MKLRLKRNWLAPLRNLAPAMNPAAGTPVKIFHHLEIGPALLLLALLGGCAGEAGKGAWPTRRPEAVRAQIAALLPARTADRAGWARDIYAAFAALKLAPTTGNICAVLAVAEQESGVNADPVVPNLPRTAWKEIEGRAAGVGVPALAVHLALKLPSPDGRSYAERIDGARTEGELSRIFEDFIGMVPLGRRLFGGFNPVRTGGPMQVAVAFAEDYARDHPYPYPVDQSLRREVFTRRGGLYFGIAHLLDYPAPYDQPLYRFADFNSGRYASRNAAFQSAVATASGIPLDLDGDLLRPGAPLDKPGSTELAVRSIGKELGLGDREIRRQLEQGDRPGFEGSRLYREVFELAEGREGRPLPRAVVPKITLHSPKMTRQRTTGWFAQRVDGRYRRCLARVVGHAPEVPWTGPPGRVSWLPPLES